MDEQTKEATLTEALAEAMELAQSVFKSRGFNELISGVRLQKVTPPRVEETNDSRGCRCVLWGTNAFGAIICEKWECD